MIARERAVGSPHVVNDDAEWTSVQRDSGPSPKVALLEGHARKRRSPLNRWVGFAAVVFSGLYVASDVVEAIQGGFSAPQLALTFTAEAAIPFFVAGLYMLQSNNIGRLGLVSAVGYAYSYVFFTGTVVYAFVHSTVDYPTLTASLGAWMTVHGVVMVISGLTFGVAIIRAGVLPRWTGAALMVGVVAVASTQSAPEAIQVVAAAIRAAAFAGMGCALLTPLFRSARRRREGILDGQCEV